MRQASQPLSQRYSLSPPQQSQPCHERTCQAGSKPRGKRWWGMHHAKAFSGSQLVGEPFLSNRNAICQSHHANARRSGEASRCAAEQRCSRSLWSPCRHPGSPLLLPASCGGRGSLWLWTISPTRSGLAMRGCTSLAHPVPPEADVFRNLLSLWQLSVCFKSPVYGL